MLIVKVARPREKTVRKLDKPNVTCKTKSLRVERSKEEIVHRYLIEGKQWRGWRVCCEGRQLSVDR